MYIWLLTSELPDEVAGGVARYIDNFARTLGAAGHQVVVVARSDQAGDEQIAPGVRLIRIVARHAWLDEPDAMAGSDTHPAYPYNILAYWPALSYQMAEEVLSLLDQLPPPDLIESQELGALPYYLLQRKLTERTRLERIPILVHLHSAHFDLVRVNQEPCYRFPGYWVGQMEKFCFVAADALLSPSHYLAGSVEQTLQRSLDITTIPYPMLIDPTLPPSDGQPGHIVYAGRLEMRKGVLPLLEACSRLWAAGQTFRLTLVGGDTYYFPKNTTIGALMQQRYARWIDSGQIKWLGQLDHAGVLEQMRQAWAVVVPSVWENFPNVCIEAMAVGQVTLVSRAGGQAEMVGTDGLNGFIFDWDRAGDFERQLSRVLALDPVERGQIAQNAQARIRALCAPEVVLPQRLQHCEAIIAHHAPRRLFPLVNNPLTSSSDRVEPLPAPPTTELDQEQAGLLSVVVPYARPGDHLDEMLDSIFAVTYPPVEVIMVSADSAGAQSGEVSKEIDQRWSSRVRLLPPAQQVSASLRTAGAAATRGEFIAFVGAEDLPEPDFFERAIEVLQRYPNVAFVYSWTRCFGAKVDIRPTWNAEFPYLLGHNMLGPSVVVRRSAFLTAARTLPPLAGHGEGWAEWIELLSAGYGGVSLPAPLVRCRVQPDSAQPATNSSQHWYVHELLTHHYAEVYREWGVELFNLQHTNGPVQIWNHPAAETSHSAYYYLYVAALEQARKTAEIEIQKLGQAWHEHQAYIEGQQAYIEGQQAYLADQQAYIEGQQAYLADQQAYLEQLAQERDRLWSQVQTYEQSWQSQDLMTRHYLKLTWKNLGEILHHPSRFKQKLSRWFHYRVLSKNGTPER